MDTALWFLRLALVGLGASLTKSGIGDEALWEVVAGATVAIVGAVWSFVARQQALATPPPNWPPAVVDDIRRGPGR